MKKLVRRIRHVIGAVALVSVAASALALEPDQLTATDLTSAQHLSGAHLSRNIALAGASVLASGLNTAAASGTGVPGIDSLANFTGRYRANGFDSNGNPQRDWVYAMIGNPPQRGATTRVRAPVIPVSIDMRNYDGTPRYVPNPNDPEHPTRLYVDATRYVRPVLNSPLFQNATYSSSERPTQFTDAVQRAEFWENEDSDWHTLLSPVGGKARVMKLVRGTYRFALNADGTCCRYVLVNIDDFSAALFPSTSPVDASTPIGAAQLNGDMTTKDLTSFLFPNTYLYFNNDPNQCCVLGFHSFDYEPGDAGNGYLPRFYVMDYASWVTPGLFGANFQDITPLSHEIAEAYNDPFVVFDGNINATPWWLSPNGNCQNDLEDGDVIEGLPNSTYPMTMHGYTYHPQNEALLPWFQFKKESDAIGKAYSYPDTSILTALSPPQKANCAP
jgi:hypothetical protein